MKIISNTTGFHIMENTAVAIGKFDGFHRGHRKLIDELLHMKNKGLAAAVFTFVPSPAVFFGGKAVQELSTVSEKRKIFRAAGVDYLIEYPFDREIADMEPSDFISGVLAERLRARCIVAGEDVSFGRNGAGDMELLERLSGKYGYSVKAVDKVMHDGREISSTFVREEVRQGNMELAAALMGSPYCISGAIIHGRQLGRTIGMPTVNLCPPAQKLLPPNGVYYSRVSFLRDGLEGRDYPSITNIGTKPTVDNRMVMGAETYIYDFDSQVYGEKINVSLLAFKRPEMRFESLEDLKRQMQLDIAQGRIYHKL